MGALYKLARTLPSPVVRSAGRAAGRHRWLQPLVSRVRPRGAVTIRHGLAEGLLLWADERTNVGYSLGTTEPDVQRALAQHLRAGDVCYDIGANVGFFSLIAARCVGPAGRVYAFDPLPENAAALRRNAEVNAMTHFEVIEAAVADHDGEARLQLGQSSLDARLSDFKLHRAGHEIPVRVMCLDHADLRPPSLVKIDAEGAEFAVLAGMRKIIRDHRPVILCEMHNYGADYAATFRDALEDAASAYHIGFVEECASADTWAPHILALPH